MRPVDRGSAPSDGAGAALSFSDHKEARDPLINAIGDYCSYCEVVRHSQVDVEHVLPQKHNPSLVTTWTNFLLACTSCNSNKGGRDIHLADYFWPNSDNTARAFLYQVDAPPRVNGGLSSAEQQIAQATIELTGLDRHPGHPQLTDRDRRWLKRREAWGVALISLNNLRSCNRVEVRQQILQVALARGFWSVWMQVFVADTEMRQLLIDSFPGTASNCFDVNTRPVARPGGRI